MPITIPAKRLKTLTKLGRHRDTVNQLILYLSSNNAVRIPKSWWERGHYFRQELYRQKYHVECSLFPHLSTISEIDRDEIYVTLFWFPKCQKEAQKIRAALTGRSPYEILPEDSHPEMEIISLIQNGEIHG